MNRARSTVRRFGRTIAAAIIAVVAAFLILMGMGIQTGDAGFFIAAVFIVFIAVVAWRALNLYLWYHR